MKNKKLILLHNNDFDRYKIFLKQNDNYDIEKVFVKNAQNQLFRLLNHFHLNPYSGWKNKLEQYDTVVIFDWAYSRNLVEYIKKRNKNITIILWFWNVISDATLGILSDKRIDRFFTFCKEDSLKYKIGFCEQFYFDGLSDYVCEEAPDSDVYFLGQDKGRKAILEKMHKYFSENKIIDKMIVIKDCDLKRFVSYEDNIKNTIKTNCVIEINNTGKKCLSLRALEALCFKKKLITNNSEIKGYDFYDSNNILVIDKDLNNIKRFLMKPYNVERASNCLAKYSFSSWVENITSGRNNEN